MGRPLFTFRRNMPVRDSRRSFGRAPGSRRTIALGAAGAFFAAFGGLTAACGSSSKNGDEAANGKDGGNVVTTTVSNSSQTGGSSRSGAATTSGGNGSGGRGSSGAASTTSGSAGASDAGVGKVSFGDGAAPSGASASALATKLGLPPVNGQQVFVFGYGQGSSNLDPYKGQYAVGQPVRITEQYLYQGWNNNGTGNGSLIDTQYAQAAEQAGAIPMFTLYQEGGDIISAFQSTTTMTAYWSDYKTVLTRVAANAKPALLNVEPDMTGYAQMVSTDPTQIEVQVTVESACSSLPNNLVGYASCLLQMRDMYAPNLLYIGFDAADWPSGATQGIAFAVAMGAKNADFATMETLDNDVGCVEVSPVPGVCHDDIGKTYWTDADFQTHLTEAQQYNTGFGLPLIWWQTPMGVASNTPGANPYAKSGWRDNRVAYFTQNAQDLVNVGGMAAVFSQGNTGDTDISSDIQADGGHQFSLALGAYWKAPVPLP